MKSLFQKSVLTLALFIAIGTAPPVAHAMQQVSRTLSIPVKMLGSVTTLDCSNAPGPQVTLTGMLLLDGLSLDLIFRNNVNKDVHTREEEIHVAVSVIQPSEQIVIPKQPVNGGTGGNPFIWIQLLDNSGSVLTDEIFLGRCVQGLFQAQPDFHSQVTAAARIAVMDCTNNPGPYITVDGGMSFDSGIKARFIFRNNDNPVGGPHEALAVRDVTIVGTGQTISFPKQPVQGGAGGNPWISARFLNGRGEPIGNEVLLGRCVQLMPGN